MRAGRGWEKASLRCPGNTEETGRLRVPGKHQALSRRSKGTAHSITSSSPRRGSRWNPGRRSFSPRRFRGSALTATEEEPREGDRAAGLLGQGEVPGRGFGDRAPEELVTGESGLALCGLRAAVDCCIRQNSLNPGRDVRAAERGGEYQDPGRGVGLSRQMRRGTGQGAHGRRRGTGDLSRGWRPGVSGRRMRAPGLSQDSGRGAEGIRGGDAGKWY